jgi:DNA-binding transcriptional regulator YhcF (GntR family)
MLPFINLDPTSGVPKYQQIVHSIINAIDENYLKIGDKLPSVNEVSEYTGLANKTVVQAFDQLKQIGVVSSVPYKGYFVSSSNTQSKHNIFLLFNSLTAYKEQIYESIKESLTNKGVVDIFFHHNDEKIFNNLIEQSAGKYTEYIIMPIDDPAKNAALEKLPQDKIFIIDLGYKDLGAKYPSVCQFFDEDIYHALNEGLERARKYRKLILVLGPSTSKRLLHDIQSGFVKFCRENEFGWEVLLKVKDRQPAAGELYITLNDQDLVTLVKKVSALHLNLGTDIGILSYNDIPFKEITANGIATISTDFTKMGKEITRLIMNKSREHIKNPCHLISRNSF